MQAFLDNHESIIVRILLVLPVVFVFLPAFYEIIKRRIMRSDISGNEETVIKRDSISRTLMKVSLCMLLAAFMQRLMVFWYNGGSEHPLEKAADAFLYALDSLGVDEDYTDFIDTGISIIYKVLGENSIWANVYRIMLSALSVAAPIAGGAIIFEVLTTVFPRARLFISRFSKKSVYIFSELNRRSLAIAKSLCIDGAKATIVFADTHLKDEKGQSAELVLQAKNLGAICISEDVARINLKFAGKKKIFLIDNEELSNIRSLAVLADSGELAGFRNTQIYVFCQDDSYNLLEQNITKTINDRLKEKFDYKKTENSADNKEKSAVVKRFEEEVKKYKSKRYEAHQPAIVRMRDFENIVLNLLKRVPLFEPLTEDCLQENRDSSDNCERSAIRNKKDFNVTVFGTGKIGTQMILSSTWCGQFYGYNLNINVVSKESRESFVRRLDKISPEILESTKPCSPILRLYNDVDKHICADPYFRMRYLECDTDNEITDNMVCTEITAGGEGKDAFNIIDSDYFVVALGSDEANIAMAEELKRNLSVRALRKPRKAVIALSVFDHNLCKAFRRRNSEETDITICAFGSLDETYEYKSFTKIRLDPRDIVYTSGEERKRAAEYRDRDKNQYNYMSDLARSIHLKYRMFSAYMFLRENSIADCEGWDVSDGFSSEKAYDGYYAKILKGNFDSLCENGPAAVSAVYDYLSWLEHRRWNAYMRSIGFSQRKDGRKAKDEKLRIHYCLVESEDYSLPGAGEKTDMLDRALDRYPGEKNKILESTEYKNKTGDERLSFIMEQRYKAFDKKYYDEPYVADEELIKWYSR